MDPMDQDRRRPQSSAAATTRSRSQKRRDRRRRRAAERQPLSPTTAPSAATRAATQTAPSAPYARAVTRTSKGTAAEPLPEGERPEDYAEALRPMLSLVPGRHRQTLPTNANVLGNLPYQFLARRQYSGLDLTSLANGQFNPQQLIDLLADAWPELSLALWNFVRLGAAEWTYEVRSADNKAEDADGKAFLDGLLSRINRHWGGFDALINQWFMSVVLQGACAGEAVPNEDVDAVADIATVQPWTIYFQRNVQQDYVAYQWQPLIAAANASLYNAGGAQTAGMAGSLLPNPTIPMPAVNPASAQTLAAQALSHGGFRELNTLTFGYVPLDTEVDDPYGRMPLAPALQLVAFDAALLKDLRQWSHNQAWGRMDVSILAERVKDLMPPAIANDPRKRRAWLAQYLSDIQTGFNNLNVDDTFVHFDNVAVTTVDASGKVFNIDNLVRLLERRIFRALKTLPILMGSNEGTTETWGSIQMEVYARGIASMQRVVASLVEKLLNVALRLEGRSSVVIFTFGQMRSTDRIKDATAEQIEGRNAAFQRDQGWITQDEASVRITGSAAVAPGPQPDNALAKDAVDAAPGQGKPGQQSTAAAPPADTAAEGKSADGQDDQKAEGEESPADTAARVAVAGDLPREGDGPRFIQELPRFDAVAHAHRAAAPLGAVLVWPARPGAVVYSSRAAADDTAHTGIIAAFWLDTETAEQLALTAANGAPADLPSYEAPAQLHVTLAYLGDMHDADVPDDGGDSGDGVFATLRASVRNVAQAAENGPLTGQVAGIGRFTSVPEGQPHVIYASVDVPGLAAFRQALVTQLALDGFPVSALHDFTPHITLAYVDSDAPTPVERVPALPLSFDRVTIAIGNQRASYELGTGATVPTPSGSSDAAQDEGDEGDAGDTTARTRATLTLVEHLAHGLAARAGTNGWRPPSQARRALVQTLTDHMGAYFRALHIPDQLLRHAYDLHTSRAVANARQTEPILANAISTCASAHAMPHDAVALRDDERDALIASLALMLTPAIPDVDDDLEALLEGQSLDAWQRSGQDALELVGLSGVFALTNDTLLDRLRQRVRATGTGLQRVTRQRVATRIADELAVGADYSQVRDSVADTLANMAGARAALIADTETSDAWHRASAETWARNGVPMKVWATAANPDPGSKGETPCRDNSYAGAIPIGESFPSGDYAPPAHGGCVCDLLPSGDPSDAAQAEPWLGG